MLQLLRTECARLELEEGRGSAWKCGLTVAAFARLIVRSEWRSGRRCRAGSIGGDYVHRIATAWTLGRMLEAGKMQKNV